MASSKLLYGHGRAHIKFSTKIKAILFDLDNTLIQTRKADVKTCKKVKSLQLARLITVEWISSETLKKIHWFYKNSCKI